MLEFQEDFFQQEIRNGFYLDVTMKTVWAAELELLQKVAEVCDKYGLAWYAAYGTLLGAIRHEGFVPWDDDMDIWMKRADYNKLMEVLQQELPKGYVVHSALSERGNDQFHTCVNNGTGINVSKEWLEQFHGCPFTVGLDIFPLDYLPREESKRELQENLFLLAASAAQIARGLDRGEFAAGEGEDESVTLARKADLIDKIEEEIACLKENCGFEINEQLLKEERWYELSSEMWKWANQVAMMYDEQESDHLVMYLDYYKWRYKKFSKEWFEDGYSASFEGFMLPIPAGYHEVLTLIYGDYNVCIRKVGMHEYPYYARQLREVRMLLEKREKEQNGGIKLVVQADPLEIPAEWKAIIQKKDGTQKKIILSANDPVMYMAYGDVALDKLENTLQQMEAVKEEIAFWWRPQPVMVNLLNRVSPALAERYQTILAQYKTAGWGICDETDNVERAVEQCDIYYGELNAVLQPFQNVGKSALIVHMEDVDLKKNNEERVAEYKAFVALSDFVDVDEKRYFINSNHSALLVKDQKEQAAPIQMIPLNRELQDPWGRHGVCVERQGKICVLPVASNAVHVYNTETGIEKAYQLEEPKGLPPAVWESFCCDGQIYLLPAHSSQSLWKWHVEEDTFEKIKWWSFSNRESQLRHGIIDENCFYTLHTYSNELYITDITKKTVKCVILPDDEIARIKYDGANFWYVACGCTDIVCWNETQGIIKKHVLQDAPYKTEGAKSPYLDIFYVKDQLFLVSQDGTQIFCFDIEHERLTKLYEMELIPQNCSIEDRLPYFKSIGNELIVSRQCLDEVIRVNLDTLEVMCCWTQQYCGYYTDEYMGSILLEKGALLYEDPELIDIRGLIKYLMR